MEVQGSAKRLALGCVNSPPAARGSQKAGFTQPRAHLLAKPCKSCDAEEGRKGGEGEEGRKGSPQMHPLTDSLL